MPLNTRARYAITALVDLMRAEGSNATPLGIIASRHDLPHAYLEQLFVRLRRAGLVHSVRGKAGGYVLAQPAERITLSTILGAVDCRTVCDLGGTVPGDPTATLCAALDRHIGGFLDRVTLADVCACRICDIAPGVASAAE